MPIRINLLAEQQAAEEMRRKDPVKRAFWASGAVIALVLLYSLNLHFKVSRAQGEYALVTSRLAQIEPGFLQVSNNFRELGDLTHRLSSLRSHTTNRFLWTPALDALQYAAIDRVRLVRLDGLQTLIEQKSVAVPTNIAVNLPPKSWWKFWGSAPETNVQGVVSQTLNAITNRTDLAPFQEQLAATVTISRNPHQVTAKISVTKPETISERIVLTLQARDYSNPPGQRVDAFYQALTNAPFFKVLLNRTNSSVQPDSIQPREDPHDVISPKDPFIPFTVEGHLPERVRANE